MSRCVQVLERTFQIKNVGGLKGRGVFTGKQTVIPANVVIAVDDDTKLLTIDEYEVSGLKGYGAEIITYDAKGHRVAQMVVPNVESPAKINTLPMLCNTATGDQKNNALLRRKAGSAKTVELVSTTLIGKDTEILVRRS